MPNRAPPPAPSHSHAATNQTGAKHAKSETFKKMHDDLAKVGVGGAKKTHAPEHKKPAAEAEQAQPRREVHKSPPKTGSHAAGDVPPPPPQPPPASANKEKKKWDKVQAAPVSRDAFILCR